jgi:hypothetical protein
LAVGGRSTVDDARRRRHPPWSRTSALEGLAEVQTPPPHPLGSRALNNRVLIGFTVVAFLELAIFAVPLPIVVAAAALGG